MTCLGVLERGERGDGNETGLKEGRGIEMSTTVLPLRAARSFALYLPKQFPGRLHFSKVKKSFGQRQYPYLFRTLLFVTGPTQEAPSGQATHLCNNESVAVSFKYWLSSQL